MRSSYMDETSAEIRQLVQEMNLATFSGDLELWARQSTADQRAKRAGVSPQHGRVALSDVTGTTSVTSAKIRRPNQFKFKSSMRTGEKEHLLGPFNTEGAKQRAIPKAPSANPGSELRSGRSNSAPALSNSLR
jgi:hypothetical protein